jgi:hypothetical protein
MGKRERVDPDAGALPPKFAEFSEMIDKPWLKAEWQQFLANLDTSAVDEMISILSESRQFDCTVPDLLMAIPVFNEMATLQATIEDARKKAHNLFMKHILDNFGNVKGFDRLALNTFSNSRGISPPATIESSGLFGTSSGTSSGGFFETTPASSSRLFVPTPFGTRSTLMANELFASPFGPPIASIRDTTSREGLPLASIVNDKSFRRQDGSSWCNKQEMNFNKKPMTAMMMTMTFQRIQRHTVTNQV